MKISSLLILIIITSTNILCEEIEKIDPAKKRYTELSNDDLKALRARAADGEGAAAYQLFLHHSTNSKTGVDGFEWLIIAAKKKHPPAVRSLKALDKQGTIESWIKSLIEE